MNEIATPTSEGCHYSWDFNGTLAEFVSKWDLPFLVLPQIPDKELGTKLRRKPSDPPAVEWAVFISDHPSFQTR